MKISTLTDKNKREQNEDNRLVIPKIINGQKVLFCVVADGMGGSDDGQRASLIVKNKFSHWFESEFPQLFNKQQKIVWEDVKSSVLRALNEINKEIYGIAKNENIRIGTTVTLLLLCNSEYMVSNIGDSRIYKFSNKPIQITVDHTKAQEYINKGQMTAKEALNCKESHLLTKCIGYTASISPDFFKGEYKQGDYFLLCSDGMYNRVDIKDMEKIVKNKKKDTKQKLTELAIYSKEKNETDNITGVLISI